MKRLGFTVTLFAAILLTAAALVSCEKPLKVTYPETKKVEASDNYHGTVIVDNYRWLEDGKAEEVVQWTEEQEKITHSIIDDLPQKALLVKRFNELWRYDDESVPMEVIDGERLFFWTKKKEEEKWAFNTKVNKEGEKVLLIDPNQWPAEETLAGTAPSRDGKYLAFGKAKGGDENPVVSVMVVETKEILPDSLKGWKQYVSSWLPDNSGFYYMAKPLKGEVPEGEEYYWHAAYFHKLGTPASEDKKVFWDDKVKEYWHGVSISEDGKYEVYYRSLFNKNDVYFRKLGSKKPLTTLVDGMEAEYSADFVEDKILIMTDKDAPNYKVYITDISRPQKKYWKEFLPEHETDKLRYIAPVNGHIYAHYLHNAYTIVKIYTLEGEYLRDLTFPTIGNGGVSGYWSKPDIWVWFSSFTYPSNVFKYDFDKDELVLYKEYPVKVDVDNYTAEQVWYESKDGTKVSMFLVHHKDLKKNGKNPVYLTGYGGFNASMTPHFSTYYVAWLEAGGMVAIPNLRGGGEYGRKWHKAGMLGNKQNVFDDFIAAAEWLIENNYTNPEKLAIAGGSNGGLLVGAATVQAPELFKVVDCGVPLLDMVNYHSFGLANVWAEEYGSSDDPEQFEYLYKYSPYHNVQNGVDYPAILITGSENDARVDPLHARKMIARMQEANPDGEPILLLVRKKSGHGGGTTLTMQIDQAAEEMSFVMYKLGIRPPK